MNSTKKNINTAVVNDFGLEWDAYNQLELKDAEQCQMFQKYFHIFPFASLPKCASGFDLGCGSGRWAVLVAPRVGFLHCIDPAEAALAVARRRLQKFDNVACHLASVDDIPLPEASQDFGYSIGVLHHIPDTILAMKSCIAKLKPDAPFLLYLYYRFDNRPIWFRAVWRISDVGRQFICRLPFPIKRRITSLIAALVYWPLARLAKVLVRWGLKVVNFPLYNYRDASFYTMRTDALDRFGTKLEQRFTKAEIRAMMESSGLRDIQFSDCEPFWVAVGYRFGNAL